MSTPPRTTLSSSRYLVPTATRVRIGLVHAGVLLVVVLLPAQWRNGWPVWDSAPDIMVQSLVGGVGYLLAAAIVGAPALTKVHQIPRALARVALAVGLAFGLLAVLPLLIPELPLSRVLLAAAAVMSFLALCAQLLSRRPAMLALLVLVVTAGGVVQNGRRLTSNEDFSVDTQFYLLSVRVHRSPELARAVAVEGGGLARLGADLLHVTGGGHFSLLRPTAEGGLSITPLTLPSPANVEDYRAGSGENSRAEWFRVVDLLAEHDGDSVRVLVSHHHWDAAAKCFTLRVSSSSAPTALSSWTPWLTRFNARPCLALAGQERGLAFVGTASGGRMLRTADGVLLTVGDHQRDGLNSTANLPQDTASDYGKIVLLRTDGSTQIVTSGHRNPQGLAQDAAGRIWSTEHGPRGGDELNLIESGSNYGWPWRTLGTEYAMRAWPQLRDAGPTFREPIFAFVPSPGISNLVAPRAERFAAWSGSLLVGTLKVRELLRVQLDGDHAEYVEEIRLGFELRDIEEAPDGTLIVWTDEGALLTIRPSDEEHSGAQLALACAGCHTMNEGQLGALGPNLHGVVGRRVGAVRDFDYSPAMQAFGGRWTPERLDAFLADPAASLPGTRMEFAGIPDDADRQSLIGYLTRTGARR